MRRGGRIAVVLVGVAAAGAAHLALAPGDTRVAPSDPHHVHSAVPRPDRIEDSRRWPPLRGPEWRVTEVRSVTDILIVTVETGRFDDVGSLARQIVEPVADEHLEALVYFRRPGAAQATARAAWTPDGGYVITTFGE